MNKLKIISIFGALAVILGAFGAHGLKPKLSPEAYTNFQTAVFYHFIHTLAMGFVYLLSKSVTQPKLLKISFYLFGIGILFFSGSLYILSTNEITAFSNPKIIGPITPIGGLLFIAGWFLLFFQKNITR